MYAAICNLDGQYAVVYLGTLEQKALDCAEQLDGQAMEVKDLDELARRLSEIQIAAQVTAFAEGLSEAAQKVLDKLNVDNAEELGRKLRDQGEKAVAEVRSLGIKGMRVVGDGFINLGELLKKADEEGDDAP